MKRLYFAFAAFVAVAILGTPRLGAQTAPSTPPAATSGSPTDRLFIYGDVVYFVPPKDPLSCVATSRVKKGDSIGFRMTAINPATGKRDRATEMVVHVTYGGKTVDLPMRDHESERSPQKVFWIAKWVVPDDASIGIVRYTVSAKDPQGRTGEYEPFQVKESELTIIE